MMLSVTFHLCACVCVFVGCYWFPWTCRKSRTLWPCCKYHHVQHNNAVLILLALSRVCFNNMPSFNSRELPDPLDPLDLLAKMAHEEIVVRLALLVVLVRLVVLDPQDSLERRDLLVLMEPL